MGRRDGVERPANDHPPAILKRRRCSFLIGRMEDGWLRFYPDDLTCIARAMRSLTLNDLEDQLRD